MQPLFSDADTDITYLFEKNIVLITEEKKKEDIIIVFSHTSVIVLSILVYTSSLFINELQTVHPTVFRCHMHRPLNSVPTVVHRCRPQVVGK